jgi:hypothetical protein
MTVVDRRKYGAPSVPAGPLRPECLNGSRGFTDNRHGFGVPFEVPAVTTEPAVNLRLALTALGPWP